MGIFRKEASHVYRSSPTPFGLRWKHDQLRLIRISSLLILAMVFMFTVVVEGAALTHTNTQKQKTVASKKVSKKSNTKKVSAKKAPAKKAKTKKTVAKSKKPTTKKSTSSNNKQSKSPKAKKSVATKSKSTKVITSSKTRKQLAASNKKATSKKVVVSAPKRTSVKKSASKTVKKSTAKTATKVATKAKAPVLAHAKLKKPTAKQIKKTIRGVTIYAYAPVKSKKSKKVDMTTSMGTRATVGQTIAVDPKIIPLGWWVYVEGLGYRKAEDVGGSIKGKKIDVFVSSNHDALVFGVKKNRTIYVVGPHLPKVEKVAKKSTSKTKPKV